MLIALQVYYDTPYDRHVILEESHDVRYRKRNSRGLEEPPSLGSRILRRLSSKTKDPNGIDNRGYQNDVPIPNSPWRYPFRRMQQPQPQHAGIQRTLSQDSTTSSIMSTQLPPPVPQNIHKIALSRVLP